MVIAEPPNQPQPRPVGPPLDPNAGQPAKEVVVVLERVLDSNMRALERYTPQPYPGAITVFRASVRLIEPYQDEYLGWKPVARGGIELEIIPGRHSAFDAKLFGQALDRHLRRAQNRVGGGVESQGVVVS